MDQVYATAEWRATSALAGVPPPPCRGIAGQRLAGDVAQRLEHPRARLLVQREVAGVVEQRRHRALPLAAAQHARLGEAAGGALADFRRRIVVEGAEQRLDYRVGAEIRETFDSPVADVDVRIVNRVEQDR